jgi:hypothetical protein
MRTVHLTRDQHEQGSGEMYVCLCGHTGDGCIQSIDAFTTPIITCLDAYIPQQDGYIADSGATYRLCTDCQSAITEHDIELYTNHIAVSKDSKDTFCGTTISEDNQGFKRPSTVLDYLLHMEKHNKPNPKGWCAPCRASLAKLDLSFLGIRSWWYTCGL